MSFYVHTLIPVKYNLKNNTLRKPLLLYDDLQRYISVYGLPEYSLYIQKILKDIRSIIDTIETYPEKAFLTYDIAEPIGDYYHFTIQVDYYWKRYINPFISSPSSIPLIWDTIDNHTTTVPIVRKYLERNIIKMKRFWCDLISVFEDIMPITHIDEMFIQESIDTIKNFILVSERKYKRRQVVRWLYMNTTRIRGGTKVPPDPLPCCCVSALLTSSERPPHTKKKS